MPDHRPASSAPSPEVTVAFLAFNRREELAESLRRMTDDMGCCLGGIETIVVDNASTDGTGAMVQHHFPFVRLLRNEKNVGASGWNRAFEVAKGDFILILDDDCYLEKGGLACAVAAAQDRDADLVSFTVVSSFDRSHKFNTDYQTGLLSYWGCAALISRRAIAVLGGYDRNIFIWAIEAELTMRLLDRGLCHLFLPEVAAVHMKPPGGGTGHFLVHPYRMNAHNFAYISAKGLRPADAMIAAANLLTSALLDAIVDDKAALTALPRIVRGLLLGIRHRSPVCREVSDAYRRNFRSFASPWRFVRSPSERLHAGMRDVASDRGKRHERYFAARPKYYPSQRVELKV